ncbi:DNA replication protein DnaD, partial [Bacillus thuringiensis]|nr:DNA replication protein DnaD [Bacillus thuringiensis]MCT4568416.1 DNA replication protein DnaD [Bacillus thuringiensis]
DYNEANSKRITPAYPHHKESSHNQQAPYKPLPSNKSLRKNITKTTTTTNTVVVVKKNLK